MGDEPNGEQYRQYQHAGTGVDHQHDTGHNAENPGYQGEHGAEACIPLHLDVKDNIPNPHHYGGYAIKENQAGKHQFRLCESQYTQSNQQDANDQLQPAKTRMPFHCFIPPVRISINSSPVMVSLL